MKYCFFYAIFQKYQKLSKRFFQAVAKIGPVVVGVNADLLIFYGGGIWDGSFGRSVCNPARVNHAVTVVGYSSIGNQSFWLIK